MSPLKTKFVRRQTCAGCKLTFTVLSLFDGKWYCHWCHPKLIQKRDAKYYKELAEGDKS